LFWGVGMNKIIGGYYLKARCIQNSEIATAPPHIREIWDWLLKEANHRDVKYGNIIIKRGQLFRSYKDIRDGLKWKIGYRTCRYNENHTKKGMKYLREHQMITTSKELGGVLITICNYDYYQNPKNYERTNGRTNEGTNAEPMRNHPLPDTNKNVKNVKNVKKKNIKKKSLTLLYLFEKSEHKFTTNQLKHKFDFLEKVSINLLPIN